MSIFPRRISSRYRPREQRDHGMMGPTRPLRCLFVITSMPVGGAETLLVNLMRRMDPQVVCPEVVCLKEPGPLGEQIQNEFAVHSDLIRGKWDVGVVLRLRRLILERKVDAVITVGAGDKMFWGRLAAWIAGVPVIASALHSTGWPDGVGKLNRCLTPITDAFIAVADSHGQFLKDFEGFPAQKVNVIRNGIDCERFRPDPHAGPWLRESLNLEADASLVGIVAALRPEKNHGLLVKAVSQLRSSHPNTHCVIVGDGPERQGIEALASELGVADRVHLLGTRHDTPRILAGLDVFALCSLNEASPVSILEALACEVPVVATDVGSVNESVLDGVTGRLVASGDADGLAGAIREMMDCAATRQRMGSRGRDLVLQAGSLESMVRGYESLITSHYDRALSKGIAGRLRDPLPAN